MPGGGGASHFSSRMAQSRGASFDSLSVELIECILEKLVNDSVGAANLTQLATLSKAFQEAARRCTRTLVLQSHRNSKKNALSGDTRDPLSILSEELALRPMIAKLIVKPRATMALVETAANMQWESATLACRAQLRAWQWGQLLSRSQFSLRSLDLESGGQLVLGRDLPSIVSSFEKLKELSLHGEFHDERNVCPQALAIFQDCGLTKLDLLGLAPSVIGRWDVIPGVLRHLTDLRNLRLQVPMNRWSSQWSAALSSGLETLKLELHRGLRLFEIVDLIVHRITMQCPSLRSLIFYSHPPERDVRAVPNVVEPAWDVRSFLERCPDLEQLVINYSIVHSVRDFAQIVQKSGLVPGMGSHWRKRLSNENLCATYFLFLK